MTELIERDTLMKTVLNLTRTFDSDYQKGYWDGFDKVLQMVNDIPDVGQALLQTCELTSTGMDEMYAEFGKCSVCGGDNYIKAKYCMWCGSLVYKNEL